MGRYTSSIMMLSTNRDTGQQYIAQMRFLQSMTKIKKHLFMSKPGNDFYRLGF